MKETIGKLGLIKIINVCSVINNVKRIRRQATEWEKILAKDPSNKRLSSKISKELLKLNKKKTKHPFLKWAKVLSRHLLTEVY